MGYIACPTTNVTTSIELPRTLIRSLQIGDIFQSLAFILITLLIWSQIVGVRVHIVVAKRVVLSFVSRIVIFVAKSATVYPLAHLVTVKFALATTTSRIQRAKANAPNYIICCQDCPIINQRALWHALDYHAFHLKNKHPYVHFCVRHSEVNSRIFSCNMFDI